MERTDALIRRCTHVCQGDFVMINEAILIYIHVGYVIRASVDALCRDDPSEISRDTRTKCLQTRRESLARPSKHTNNNF